MYMKLMLFLPRVMCAKNRMNSCPGPLAASRHIRRRTSARGVIRIGSLTDLRLFGVYDLGSGVS